MFFQKEEQRQRVTIEHVIPRCSNLENFHSCVLRKIIVKKDFNITEIRQRNLFETLSTTSTKHMEKLPSNENERNTKRTAGHCNEEVRAVGVHLTLMGFSKISA